ncbi:MAG: GAF domain-containing sensor histidine kinase [Anaerolineae bacterium]|nr:GAF domain-containing sensor histidine kinase [Anaerolineae bacterium]
MLSLSNDQLQRTNSQLRLLQELTLSLQSAVSPVELQEVLLQGLVKDVGYHGAVVALADEEGRLGGWCWLRNEDDRCHRLFECVLDLETVDSPVTRTVRAQKPEVYPSGMPPTGVTELDEAIALQNAYGVFPLHLRGHPIGVLIVELTPKQTFLAAEDLNSLALVANHTSVALGSLRLCIERTQRLAAEEIRNRIAADIHDSVSQQLFGLAYGLNACNQLLAQNPDALPQVKAQLADLEPLAFAALHEMRSAIWGLWSGGLDARRLASGLRRHMAALAMDRPVALDIRVTPAFDSWPSELRHQLLLIAQEGVANIARHARAQTAQIVIAQDDGRVLLTIADDGVGFDPNRVTHKGGFGLESMRRRVERLGGVFCSEATPGQGVRLTITIPLPRP